MLPLQLVIHFSKSHEISHEKDHDKRKNNLLIFCLVERVDEELSWGSLFQFKIDPVLSNMYLTRFPPSGWDFPYVGGGDNSAILSFHSQKLRLRLILNLTYT